MNRIRMLTRSPRAHFYGYYGINPWDSTGRFHLALETDFDRRPPLEGDWARVGVVERAAGEFRSVAATRAFNFQQGSMLHWIDVGHGEEITYNDWDDGVAISRAVDLRTGHTRSFERPVAAVASDRRTAIGLDYGRNYHCRKVVGYANNRSDIDPCPEDDGLWLTNLGTGSTRLALSVAAVARAAGARPTAAEPMWLDHVVFNPSASRVLFFGRIKKDHGFMSSLWTVDPDGRGLECRIPLSHWISHFAWRDDRQLLISTDLSGKAGFVLMEDHTPNWQPFGESAMPSDGHGSFSPDGRWVVCDTSPHGASRVQGVMLYHPESGRKAVVGQFVSEPVFTGDIRCDLHPRWSADGREISIDTVDGGDRQIALIDVSDIVNT